MLALFLIYYFDVLLMKFKVQFLLIQKELQSCLGYDSIHEIQKHVKTQLSFFSYEDVTVMNVGVVIE
jgi:hypothetical protein